ncbi:interferon-induced helicase C domain-containing protein 1 [Elysia marginata]|uniref:Interferon-induced helicase C domain-containing protein 1 n=1 Tax=Elysia marginata TaxID=1093978 RepID=A0AAV4GS54_9GAST|nr:interferon-induced helicase C domain-containing protein 1 [Elysia marginata]
MTQPVFVLARNLPDGENYTNYDICLAASKSIGRQEVGGAQRINSLWRIYVNGPEARIKLLSKGLTINGINIEVSSQNPLLLRGSDGKEVPTTKLLISDIPISVANEALEAALIKKGLTLRSKIKMEGIRDPQGKLTEW